MTQQFEKEYWSKERLAIVYNPIDVECSCPICERQAARKTPTPLWIFKGNDDPVCYGCAREYAPELAALLDYYYSEQWQEDHTDKVIKNLTYYACLMISKLVRRWRDS